MAEETETPTPAAPAPQTGFVRGEDFWAAYANNVQLEATSIDVKLIFGELDLHGGNPTVEQHTSITMSWVQAKLLNYFLSLNLAAHEAENGKIKMPNNTLPPRPSLPKNLENEPKAKALVEMWTKMYDEFIANLPA